MTGTWTGAVSSSAAGSFSLSMTVKRGDFYSHYGAGVTDTSEGTFKFEAGDRSGSGTVFAIWDGEAIEETFGRYGQPWDLAPYGTTDRSSQIEGRCAASGAGCCLADMDSSGTIVLTKK